MQEVPVNSEALVKLEKVHIAQMWPNKANGLLPGQYPPMYSVQEMPVSNEDALKLSKVFVKEAIKHDDGKVDWSLVPFEALEGMANVLTFGAKKYAAWNWTDGGGFKWTRLLGSCLRHLFAFARGEDLDPESGISHISHAQCNLLFLAYYIRNKEKFSKDDRNVR